MFIFGVGRAKSISSISFIFSAILFLQTNCIIASPLYDAPGLDLTVPLNRCVLIKESDKDGVDSFFASDNISKLTGFSFEGKLFLYDAADSRFLWITELGLQIASNILFKENSMYLIGRSEAGGNKEKKYFFNVISNLTGLTNRRIELNLSKSLSNANEANEVFFLGIKKERIIVLSGKGDVFFFDSAAPADRLQTEKLRVGKTITSSPFFSGDNLIVGTSDNKIVIIPFERGAATRITTTQISVSGTVSAVVYTHEGNIIYGDRAGSVVALDKANKTKLWKFRAGAAITDITQTTLGTLISSSDNYIYLISTMSGRRLWKKRMTARVFSKPLIREGFAVVANLYEAEAEVIELKTGRTVNRLFLDKEDVFEGDGFLFSDSVVFPTLKGLIGFTSMPGKCANDSQR